jgi:predicted alpha/beta superfamily hydrolase
MRRPRPLDSRTRPLALPIVPLSARAQGGAAGSVTIGKIDSIFSPTLKEQRPYLVYTPPSYSDTTYTKRGYPVLYLLDGDAHFHSVTGLLQILGTGVNATFVVPEMIVVAIPNTNRMRDLTPTQAARDFEGKADTALRMTGGGPKFLNFMKSELIPHIDATYRTAPYRVFVGHSLGGLMAFQALYTMPEVFNAYVAIDPSLWWDDRRLLKQAPAFFGKATAPGRTLFVTQANTLVATDTIDNPHYNSIVRLNAIVEAGNASGVRYAFRYYPNDSHGSVPLISEYDALRFIFDGFQPDLFRALEEPERT